MPIDMSRRVRFGALAATLALIVAAIVVLERPWDDSCQTVDVRGAAGGKAAPDLCASTAWVQGDVDLHKSRGEVILVDFWTYSCVNCIRTLPHLTAWYNNYEGSGFTIVGVHSPEFGFEKDPDNVRDAIERYEIRYPVIQDNDHAIWDNYHNRFWPAKYLIDAHGQIQYTHFGEGAYYETEDEIRRLLIQAGHTDLPPRVETTDAQGNRGEDVTSELYLGYWRQPWTLGQPYQKDQDVQHTVPDDPLRDRVYLDGVWNHGEEAVAARTSGSVQLRFHAGGTNIVADGPRGCVPVTLDGAPIARGMRGADVVERDGITCFEVDGARSYDLFAGPVDTHTVGFDVPEGFQLWTFAFGWYDQEGA